MYLDHPVITATNSETEFDRVERLNRVYGYAIGLADAADNALCIDKLARLHDHKGRLIVQWHSAPTAQEQDFFRLAWQSRIGDETALVTHELGDIAIEENNGTGA